MKHKPIEPRLYPGETNALMVIQKMLQQTRNLMAIEIERLEKLRTNPTFPKEHYAAHLGEIQKLGAKIAEEVQEVSL